MTCGSGTAGIPKDYKFENVLRMKLTREKFDKIIYYDTCIIAVKSKEYGKIIISDDSVYTFVESNKKFNLLSHFKDIISMDLVNDIPQFIIGPMQDDCVHIKLIYYKAKQKVAKNSCGDSERSPCKRSLCCMTSVKEGAPEASKPLLSTNASSAISDTGNSSNLKMTSNTDEILVESIDFYVLNKYSPAMALLKRAYIDYLIAQTLNRSSELDSTYKLTPQLISHLFEGLIVDISLTISSVNVHRDFLMELIQSGYKYTRIKILFWSKPDLFGFMVEQFVERIQILFSIDSSKVLHETESSVKVKQLIYTCLDCVNIFLQVFNIFFFQTDHLLSKWERLRKNNANLSISLLRNVFELVCYLNKHDRCDSPNADQSEIDLNIDYTKYDITINSIQLFYYLVSSSQVPFSSNEEADPFTTRSISCLIETLISYDNNDAVVNSFINHALRMILIWLFPEAHNFKDQLTLPPQNVVTIFQFFTTFRTLLHCIPKMMEILRREMKEEFHYFMSHEISFSEDYYLSKPTLRLLKSFQKNVMSSNADFVD